MQAAWRGKLGRTQADKEKYLKAEEIRLKEMASELEMETSLLQDRAVSD